MKRRLFTAWSIALLFTGAAAAQYRRDPPPRGPGDRTQSISRIVADCEERTNIFQRSFRRALDHSGYRGTMRQADLTRHADSLERAMNQVRESWNRERNPDKTRHFVSRAIDVSQSINQVMSTNRFHPDLHSQWASVRIELNRLAEGFGLPRLRWR
jgi:pterin-4a-carbinolamine dehydratase